MTSSSSIMNESYLVFCDNNNDKLRINYNQKTLNFYYFEKYSNFKSLFDSIEFSVKINTVYMFIYIIEKINMSIINIFNVNQHPNSEAKIWGSTAF